MAPKSADPVLLQGKPRRPASRIVPAVPLAFSKGTASARPITPDGTATENEKVTQPTWEPQELEDQGKQDEPTAQLDTPMTPDSRASAPVSEGSEQEQELARPGSDPPRTVEEPPDTRDTQDGKTKSPVHDAPLTSNTEQLEPFVNGHSADGAPNAFHPPEQPSQIPMQDMSDLPLQSPSYHGPLHRPQPSLEGIVFGTAQESPQMPSTPHDMEPDARPLPQPAPRQIPGFTPSQYAAPFFPGHSHHPSGSGATWYPPMSMAPPDTLYGHGRDFAPPVYPNPLYPVAHQGVPGHPVMANGAAQTPRSHSQSPIKSQQGDPRPGSDLEDEPRAVQFTNGFHVKPSPMKLHESAFEVAAYLSSQFGNPEFAEYILQVRSDSLLLMSIPVHAIVVDRSPIISATIKKDAAAAYQAKDKRVLVVSTLDKFVTAESLTEALKALYGSPLLAIEAFVYSLRPQFSDGEQGPTFAEARKRTSQGISYAAAGEVLGIRSVQMRGVEIAKALLRWDTFDLVLQYALDGCPVHSSEPSSQNGSAVAHNGGQDPHRVMLLREILDFMAFQFPADFGLYSIAPELTRNPRLPNIIEHRQPTHNPRLSRLQFGDVPPEEPNYVARIISSVLLSMPLSFLQQLFSHPALANQIGWTRVGHVMQDVIVERERRRRKALGSSIRPAQDGSLPKALLENLYWEEHAEQSGGSPAGYKLSETRMEDHV
ncbi:hypothetical protein EJ04DRAFT_566516 [Polyplosphaeria fusca]|uniref:Uncharacterized protein n=1 Tax=Polyplosphaeria fusca TaxID=682080 RepID=A0A9P4QV16_9PLEO|nr:hypothetical protein EJ04DRAFT_566516 [Polyplosphaeria fusca]